MPILTRGGRHTGARLAERIRSGWTITAAARAVGVSRQTGSKWVASRPLGEVIDRRSAPCTRPASIRPSSSNASVPVAARSGWDRASSPERWVWRDRRPMGILRRRGLSRLDRLEPRDPVARYVAAGQASSSIKGGRPGWDRVDVAIDDSMASGWPNSSNATRAPG